MGGRRNAFFYLTWRSSGSVSSLSQSMRRSALGSTSGSQCTDFIALLHDRTAGGRGRALGLVLCWHHSCVSMARSGFPQDRGRQEEAGSAADKGELGQHPAQNMPPSQGGSRQVGYLGSVPGVVGSHGSGIVFLLIEEERILAIHTIEINIATKPRCL